MTQSEMLVSLGAEAQRIAHLAPGATWYLFGSTLRTAKDASDIDVLILCDSHDTAVLVRSELREACIGIPLHLFLLTSDEEAELEFIVREGCVQIFPER